MSNKNITVDDLTTILEDKNYQVAYKLTTEINTNNSGTLDTQMLERAKRAFIMETVGVWSNELISTRQEYPKENTTEVTFGIDVVILKRKEFDKIKRFYEQLLESREESINYKV